MLKTAEDRTQFLDVNMEKVQWAQRRATENGATDVLVILADMTDPFGDVLAQHFVGAMKDEFKSQCLGKLEIPTLTLALNRWATYKALRQIQKHVLGLHPSNPKVSRAVEALAFAPPPGKFWVVVWSGGKLVAHVPILK